MKQPWFPFDFLFGLGIVQGVILSEADVGTEGFSEPFTKKRRLPTGRRFQQQAAVDGGKRVREPATSVFATQFTTLRMAPWYSC